MWERVARLPSLAFTHSLTHSLTGCPSGRVYCFGCMFPAADLRSRDYFRCLTSGTPFVGEDGLLWGRDESRGKEGRKRLT